MPRFKTIQRRFTQGELDPRMIGRADVDQYYGAVAEAVNVLPLPQGGFRRRPGLEYIDTMLGLQTALTGVVTAPNGGTTGNLQDGASATQLVTSTGISTTDPYVVFQIDYSDPKNWGALHLVGVTISTGTGADFRMQGSNDGTNWTNIGEAVTLNTTPRDFGFRVFAAYRYLRFARIGSTDLATATVTVSEFYSYSQTGRSNVKLMDFVFNEQQTYLLAMSDKNVSVYLNGVFIANVRTNITSDQVPEADWVQAGDTLLLFHKDWPTQRILRNSTTGEWSSDLVPFDNTPTYDFGGISYGSITVTPAAASGSTHITASSAIFTADMVGWVYRSFDQNGYARITAFVSATRVDVDIVDAFDGISASADWALEEPIWSSTRGWPRHGCFHQNRLYVDGGKSRPAVVYGSVVNDFYNFDFGTALDDQAIGPLGGGEFNPVTAIYSSTNLIVFTIGGEYIAPQSLGEPLTPANANLLQQSKVGSAENVRPQEADGGVLFVQRGGTSVQELLFDDTQNRLAPNLISLLSNHLITGITQSAMRKSTSADDGSYLLLVRSDGKLIIANIMARQNIASFTPHITAGEFVACGVDREDMFVAVNRTINGQAVQYLERFNNDFTTDCAKEYKTGLPTDTFSGLAFVEGETLFALADGNLLNSVTVSGGSVTIERDADTRLEVGLNYTPQIKDLPVENEQVGSVYGMLVNISEIVLDLYQTKHLTVNGKQVSFRVFGPSVLDIEAPSYTGRKRMLGWRGWSDTGQITISQTLPLPMTVLAVSKRVNV